MHLSDQHSSSDTVSENKKSISFIISLTDDDWSEADYGWFCDCLRIPDALISSLSSGRTEIHKDYYQVVHDNLILWKDPLKSKPERLRAHIEIKSLPVSASWKSATLVSALGGIAAVIGALATLFNSQGVVRAIEGIEGIARKEPEKLFMVQGTISTANFPESQRGLLTKVTPTLSPPQVSIQSDGNFSIRNLYLAPSKGLIELVIPSPLPEEFSDARVILSDTDPGIAASAMKGEHTRQEYTLLRVKKPIIFHRLPKGPIQTAGLGRGKLPHGH